MSSPSLPPFHADTHRAEDPPRGEPVLVQFHWMFLWNFFHRQPDHLGIAGMVDNAAAVEQQAVMANDREIVFHLIAFETLVKQQDVFQ